MKTRSKLIRATRRANLSGMMQTAALVIYDEHGLDLASRFIEQEANKIKLGAMKLSRF